MTTTPSSVLTQTRPGRVHQHRVDVLAGQAVVPCRCGGRTRGRRRRAARGSARRRCCPPRAGPARSVSSVLMTAEARLVGSLATGRMRSTGRPLRTRFRPLFVATQTAPSGPGAMAVDLGVGQLAGGHRLAHRVPRARTGPSARCRRPCRPPTASSRPASARSRALTEPRSGMGTGLDLARAGRQREQAVRRAQPARAVGRVHDRRSRCSWPARPSRRCRRPAAPTSSAAPGR